MTFNDKLAREIANKDIDLLTRSEIDYGSSWCKRGGVDSFFMLARKWDRIEKQVEGCAYNILEACRTDLRPEGILDDIGDLRRYLFLVETKIRNEVVSTPFKEQAGVVSEEDGELFARLAEHCKTKHTDTDGPTMESGFEDPGPNYVNQDYDLKTYEVTIKKAVYKLAYKYLAMDKSGNWFNYSKLPTSGYEGWVISIDCKFEFVCKYLPPNTNWKNSLISLSQHNLPLIIE